MFQDMLRSFKAAFVVVREDVNREVRTKTTKVGLERIRIAWKQTKTTEGETKPKP